MSLGLWMLPLVGGAIGWMTNLIAVRMLFRPKRPIRIPLLGMTLQGVLPSRHAELAASVGRIAAEELLPVAELVERVDVAGLKEELQRAVAAHVEERLHTGMARLVPAQWRAVIVGYVRDLVAREADGLLDTVMERLRAQVEGRIDVAALVTEKILQLDLDSLEDLAVRIAGREVRAIVFLGALLGFFVGLVQMGIMLWLLPGPLAG
ncbi:MAG TPA: DUF445 family protein [Limnochordales bacterium]|nr:DUF445 family protein [Limnochordales bacterium]